jgi:5-hydroxyisourate hydrolase
VSAITTHVLDTALGQPAAGVPVRLERAADAGPAADGAGDDGAGADGTALSATPVGATVIGRASTDQDGRASDLGPAELEPGTYRLVFDTGAYSRARAPGELPFFPEVTVTFAVADPTRHYHVPLLLSPFGYSTYRGS